MESQRHSFWGGCARDGKHVIHDKCAQDASDASPPFPSTLLVATDPPLCVDNRAQLQGSANNALCFIGPHRKYNPFSQNFYELVPGQGHFGPDAIPGDARWRRGESVSQKAARDSMVSLEVAAHSQLALRPANSFA